MLLRKPALLVLDEATSDLDQNTEEMFQRVLELNFANATILCIAHRIETLRWCKTKIEMGWGKLLSISNVAVETGDVRTLVSEAVGNGVDARSGR